MGKIGCLTPLSLYSRRLGFRVGLRTSDRVGGDGRYDSHHISPANLDIVSFFLQMSTLYILVSLIIR